MLSCEKHKANRPRQRIRRLQERRRLQQELHLLRAVVATLQDIGLLDRHPPARE